MKHYDELGNVIYAHHKQTAAQKQADVTNVSKGQAGLAEGQQLTGQMNKTAGTLLPAYQSILAKPGYDDPTKSAMTLNTLGGLGASFGDAQNTAMNRMARTRNTAGFGDTLDELARERGRQTSTAEAGLQEKFADTALSERDKALSGMSNLYGIDSRTMESLLDPKAMNPNQPGFLQSLLPSLISAGGQVGAAAIGKPP